MTAFQAMVECRARATRIALCLIVLSTASGSNAWAQCADPSTHFRGGIWKQWILQIMPGPAAQAAIQQVISEVNAARAAASLPLLVFDPEEVLAISFIEEQNPRGPDGALLTNRLPNQEIFFATFAGTTNGGFVVLFLADALRSNADLTAKGVPGAPAAFDRTMKFDLTSAGPEVSTKWTAENAGDRVAFRAEYSNSTARSRFPGPATYLSCNLAKSFDVVFRALPTQMFGLFERAQSAFFDLSQPGVEVRLKVRHHDANINTMFNDPANQFVALFENDRVIRFEREQ